MQGGVGFIPMLQREARKIVKLAEHFGLVEISQHYLKAGLLPRGKK